MQDRRSDNRKPTILEGRIRIDGEAQDIECTVRDLSAAGAQIWVTPEIDLPGEFDLDIPKREMSVRAQVVWANGRTRGVAFVQAQPASARGGSRSVQDILADARRELAQVIGLPAASIRLRLEIEG